jgi:pantoate--beta-alanine ligase
MTERITALPDLRARIAEWRHAGERIALVPTMGALHAGHMALVAKARKHADRVVVSIFVNPAQFGPSEDFSRYPRTLEADMALLTEHGADVAWVPDVKTMYPEGFSSKIEITGITEILEGEFRPGHFNGVATVVAKLLQQVAPDTALVGEKDYQQLCVIRRMAKDFDFATNIDGVPTIREPDGLALSSRNRYLAPEERAIAPKLYEGLATLAQRLPEHMNEHPFIDIIEQWIREGFTKVDYLELCDAETLAPLAVYKKGARLLVAAWLGKTRLIDNIEV